MSSVDPVRDWGAHGIAGGECLHSAASGEEAADVAAGGSREEARQGQPGPSAADAALSVHLWPETEPEAAPPGS